MDFRSSLLDFDLSQFIKLSSTCGNPCTYDDCFCINRTISSPHHLPDSALRLNGYVVLLWESGGAHLSNNRRDYRIFPNMLLVCPPESICHLLSIEQSEISVMYIKPEFLNYLNILSSNSPNTYSNLRNSIMVKLSDEDAGCLSEMIISMERYISDSKENVYYKECTESIIRAIMFRIFYLVEKYNQSDTYDHSANEDDAYRNSVDSCERYFNKFIGLLAKDYRNHRQVKYYAKRMNLAPKYLSRIIKESSGIHASVWIDRYVVSEAKNMLRYSDMNIQQIAYELNFADPSFFGKYFKKHTGYSPKEYRAIS